MRAIAPAPSAPSPLWAGALADGPERSSADAVHWPRRSRRRAGATRLAARSRRRAGGRTRLAAATGGRGAGAGAGAAAAAGAVAPATPPKAAPRPLRARIRPARAGEAARRGDQGAGAAADAAARPPAHDAAAPPAGGYATMATVTARRAGQVNYLDKYGGGGDTGRWMTPTRSPVHRGRSVHRDRLLAILARAPGEAAARRHGHAPQDRHGGGGRGHGRAGGAGTITASKEASSPSATSPAHQIIGYTRSSPLRVSCAHLLRRPCRRLDRRQLVAAPPGRCVPPRSRLADARAASLRTATCWAARWWTAGRHPGGAGARAGSSGGAIVLHTPCAPQPVLIANTGTGFAAMQAICPHAGCELAWWARICRRNALATARASPATARC